MPGTETIKKFSIDPAALRGPLKGRMIPDGFKVCAVTGAVFRWTGRYWALDPSVSDVCTIARPTVAFDPDLHLLNCQNGVVDLRTGDWLSHNQDLLMSRLCRVEYRPQVRSPIFDKFVQRAMGGDARQIRYLQKLASADLMEAVGPEIKARLKSGDCQA